MINYITKKELFQAQLVLLVAIALQVVVWLIDKDLFSSQYLIIASEIFLVFLLGFTVNQKYLRDKGIHKAAAVIMLGLITSANISSLVIVLHSLIITHIDITGLQLLSSALAIFITNIIVFALWYWEIDSPGLTRKRWSKNNKDFQFVQQDLEQEFPQWQPEFIDYLYLSVTNALNFAPADTRPLSRQAKLLMGSQSLVSIFTLAIVIARSVTILGA